MNLRDYKTVAKRREGLEAELGVKLTSLGDPYPSEDLASSRNCENMIGTVRVPVGVVGPLKINAVNFSSPRTEFFVPLATTEGALVASVNRGVKAIGLSGGVEVVVSKKGASRGPSFITPTLLDNQLLGEFIHVNFSKLRELAAETSSHLQLLDFHTTTLGRRRFVRFTFDASEAMGMNMVTIATQKLADFITHNTNAKLECLSANYCADKKPNWQNVVLGRGYVVDAEVKLTQEVLEKVLKTNAADFYKSWLAKTQGSMLVGAIGNNAQAANVLAALYLATGQDLGHIGEGSQVFTTTDKDSNPDSGSLIFGVHLPDLMLGTVGGGTGLSTQKQCLALMGLTGNSLEGYVLSAIAGALVLAGEISLLASLSENSLVRAHESLARGRKI